LSLNTKEKETIRKRKWVESSLGPTDKEIETEIEREMLIKKIRYWSFTYQAHQLLGEGS
jgi:hypothetical protein